MKRDHKTEERILLAARQVFVKKGYEGARMQEIADVAGINKSLLHYYYRNKDKLFESIFSEAFFRIIPKILQVFASELTLEQKIDRVVNEYLDLLEAEPFLPGFVLNELGRKPDYLEELFSQSGVDFKIPLRILGEQIRARGGQEIPPLQFLVNLISTCVFPFVARPLLEKVLEKQGTEDFGAFIAWRRAHIKKMVFNSIQ